MDPARDVPLMSHVEYLIVQPFTRYVVYVEAQPVATKSRGAISNMLIFTTDMSGQHSRLQSLSTVCGVCLYCSKECF